MSWTLYDRYYRNKIEQGPNFKLAYDFLQDYD